MHHTLWNPLAVEVAHFILVHHVLHTRQAGVQCKYRIIEGSVCVTVCVCTCMSIGPLGPTVCTAVLESIGIPMLVVIRGADFCGKVVVECV